MAMPKKGTRRITVSGCAYRWLVSPNDGFMTLVAELAEEPGQRLEAYFKYHDVYEPEGKGVLRIVGQRRSISPGVRLVIETALARGWRPSARGLDMHAFPVPDAEQLLPADDESIRQLSGSGLLRVDAERGVKPNGK